MTNNPTPQNVKAIIDSSLDSAYEQAMNPVIRAIVRGVSAGIVAQRLAELQAEAQRLQADGQNLTPDNPILRALIADLTAVLAANATLIDGVAPDLQALGTQAGMSIARALASPLPDNALAALGIQWRQPDAERLAALVNYLDSDAWRDALANYQNGIVRTINNIVIGERIKNPRNIARAITQAVQLLPRSYAEQLTRSVQLTSYRDATAITYAANRDVISHHVRISARDSRVCLACLALDGEILAVGERVNDHRNGRCTSIPVLRGQNRTVEQGSAWLEKQPEPRKREIMGNANYEAYKAGKVKLEDFAQRGTDAIFGEVVNEASLKGILGDDARKFYSVGGS